MGSINSALSIATGALDADQAALNVVANNVANANTTGYTEETPDWQENAPINVGGIQVGDGVTETGSTSQRDRVLEERLDQQQQLASASTTRLAALNTMQALFTPDSGSSSAAAGDIGSDITSFFDSFSSLEAAPTDEARREAVLSAASTLAGDISSAANSLNQQSASLDQGASSITSQVNSLTGSIAQLNLEIQSISPHADAGTLEDQRQQDLSQLSQLIGINQITTENNGLTITTTSGQMLVSEGQNVPLTTGIVNGVTHFFVGATDLTSQLTTGGGQLGGYLTARDQDVPSVLSSLDQLAYGISTRVNALNNAGTDQDGAEGTGANSNAVIGNGSTPLYIFNQPTQVTGSAVAMSVTMTDPNQIAAAGFGDGTGDNSNAINIAKLANEAVIGALATTSFSMTQNLSSATPVSDSVAGKVEVYDSLGNVHEATVTYTNQGSGAWNYNIALADTLTADTSVDGQVSYTFGAGETVDPSTDLTITGVNGSGTPTTITAPTLTAGETVGSAGPPATGYVAALDQMIQQVGIVGVSVSNTNGVLTITGAAATSGSVVADAAATTNASGTLQFDGNGKLVTPAADVSNIGFSGLSDGAAALNLTWDLFGANGTSNITQTAAASLQTAQSQAGAASDAQTPSNFYSNLVTSLGSTVSEVQTENAAQTASVTQLQTQNNSLSSVNLNDEAAAMSKLETSYQAASQVFTLLNTIMTSALNLGVETAVS
jgi:flagellar hook-associated protein 1 FlgK